MFMPDPITTSDLYGPSSEATPTPAAPFSPLPVEETPEIPMQPPPPPPQKKSAWSAIGVLLLLIGLFGVGVWAAMNFGQLFPNGLSFFAPNPTPTPAIIPTPTPANPFANWKTYQVISGTTKTAVPGFSFQLPSTVLAPICDTANCASQGTYLPGGTRFTVAARGTGQILSDFRGSAISDVNGLLFNVKDGIAAGVDAREFTGSFSGKTVTGYAFTRMRGVMIPVSATLSVEINHFTPAGITTDWAADDMLFDQILQTVSLTAMIATPTAAPTVATSSGY